jgi:pimeloyl-ACP methyl ester carboxylesterase
MTAADWKPHIERLSRPEPGRRALRTLCYDQRGHGSSTLGRAELTMELLGRDLARVLDWHAANGGGDVLLIGHSMGSMAIQHLAAAERHRFGDRIRGVALISSSIGEVGPTPDSPVPSVLARSRARFQHLLVASIIQSHTSARVVHGLLTGPLSHPTTLPLWRLAVGSGPDAELARVSARAFHSVRPDWIVDFYTALSGHQCTGRLAALEDVPTRIVVGAEDRCTPAVQARELAAEIPGATLQIVPRVGHNLPYDRPELVVDTAYALLDEIRGPLRHRLAAQAG